MYKKQGIHIWSWLISPTMAICRLRGGETSKCSVQEAGNLRTRETKDVVSVWGWRPGRSLKSLWCKFMFKGWRIWSLMFFGDDSSKQKKTKKQPTKQKQPNTYEASSMCVRPFPIFCLFCSIWGSCSLDGAEYIQGRVPPFISLTTCQSSLEIPRGMLCQFSRCLSIQSRWQPRLSSTVGKYFLSFCGLFLYSLFFFLCCAEAS
jgi:hypothetical protein